MTRRLLVVIAAALVLVIAACGEGVEEVGGGGVTVATTDDTKPDTTDTTLDDGGDSGDVDAEIPPGQDPRNILGTEGPEEDAAAEACFDGDLAACDELFRITDVGGALESYAQTCGGRIDEVEGAPECETRFPGPPQPPGDLTDDPELADTSQAQIAEFEDLADECFDGDFEACDDLFLQTPIDSEFEDYGRSCGGRFEEGIGGTCVDRLGDAAA